MPLFAAHSELQKWHVSIECVRLVAGVKQECRHQTMGGSYHRVEMELSGHGQSRYFLQPPGEGS